MVDYSWNRVKDRIYSRLHSATYQNIEDLIRRPLAGDICQTWFIDVSDQLPGKHLCVPKTMLSFWGISEDQFFTQARQNDSTVRRVIKSITRDLDRDALQGYSAPGRPIDMYLITNEELPFGASAILASEIQEELIFTWFGADAFYLLPANISEWIAVSASDVDLKTVSYLVKDINHRKLSPKECLSDHIYTITDGKFSLVV